MCAGRPTCVFVFVGDELKVADWPVRDFLSFLIRDKRSASQKVQTRFLLSLLSLPHRHSFAPMSLPTISLQSAHLAQEVYEACTSSGFFFLQDHGIDAEKLGAWRASQLLFLDESEDVKRQQTASIDREAHTGYTSM